MISRYTRPEFELLWSETQKYETWLQLELAVMKVQSQEKLIPTKAYEQTAALAKVDVQRITQLEEKTRHDVLAFTESIAEQVGPWARYFHFGLTSSDVVDTAGSLRVLKSLDLILKEVSSLMKTFLKLAWDYRYVSTIGRTHGRYAEPMIFGLKFLGAYQELSRHRQNLLRLKKKMAFGKLSGAVGIYGVNSPLIEKKVLKSLKLSPEPIATQILPRDRFADLVCGMALLAASMERWVLQVRLLQQSGLSELEEPFRSGQKGSSAMPHKRNPILCENITGCARLMRSYVAPALENVALWHERDMSHSSAERVFLPDALGLSHFMLVRTQEIFNGLTVHSEQVAKHLQEAIQLSGAGRVLLKLVEQGMSREEAYTCIQKASFAAEKEGIALAHVLSQDEKIQNLLKPRVIRACFDVEGYMKYVDQIYERCSPRHGFEKKTKKSKIQSFSKKSSSRRRKG